MEQLIVEHLRDKKTYENVYFLITKPPFTLEIRKNEERKIYLFGILYYIWYDEEGINRYTQRETRKEGFWIKYGIEGNITHTMYHYDENLNGPYTLFSPEGTVKVKGMFHDGKRVGTWLRFHSDGKVEEETKYQENSEDYATVWYKNGQRNFEGNLRHERKEGLWINWYESGQKESEGYYKNGQPSGPWTYWFENGQLASECTYDMDQRTRQSFLVGVYTIWDEDGSLDTTREYQDGEEISQVIYYTSGPETSNHYNKEVGEVSRLYGKGKDEGWIENKKQKGLWLYRSEDGYKKIQRTYKNGILDGRWVETERYLNWYKILTDGEYRNGLREGRWKISYNDEKMIGWYKNGKKNGLWAFFYENRVRKEGSYHNGIEEGRWICWEDEKWYIGEYQNGKRTGEWKAYLGTNYYYTSEEEYYQGTENYRIIYRLDEDVVAKGNYSNNVKNGVWTFSDSEGKSEGKYHDGKREGRWVWYKNDKVQEEGIYRNGEKEGPWVEWHENGKKKSEGEFQNGLKDGPWIYWDANGEIQSEGRYFYGIKVGIWHDKK